MGKSVHPQTGHILALTSAFFYGLQVVLGKFMMQTGMDAKDLLVLQYTGGTCFLLAFLLIRRKKCGLKPDRKFFVPIILQGVLGCCATSFFFYLSMERIAAGISSMLLYLCPVYVCIFFMLTGIRKITLANKVAVVMAFSGALLVLNVVQFGSMKWSVAGLILGAISGICYAFYGIFADIKLKEMPAEQMLFYMYFVGTMTFWALNPQIFVEPPYIAGSKAFILLICLMILQVLPMALLNLAIRKIGANKATVIATAELPFTIILAFIILKESMSIIQVLGIVLIVAAIILIQVKKEKVEKHLDK